MFLKNFQASDDYDYVWLPMTKKKRYIILL